ncbi:MAG: anti-sigma factor antagonist [Desulfovibrio sp.]|nr:MAG: anti-sigma factor antagonist [Desulfovibrio sp.]
MSDVTRTGNKAVVTPSRNITAGMTDSLRKELKSLLDEGVTDLTIDFSRVEMLDSVGIGLLIAAHNSLLKEGAVLRLTGVNQDVMGLLSTMRLTSHFSIHSSHPS